MNTDTAQVIETSAPAVALTATVDQLQAQVAALTLQLNAKDSIVKVPVSDADFEMALKKMDAANAESLNSENPPARADLSLTKALGVTPAMTKEQKALWNPFKSKWEKAFSAKHRVLIPQRRAILSRVMLNPNALVATVAKQRKDGTVSRVSLSAKEPAKVRKGKGLKKAKPAQVAAHVPAAGNAAEPAKVS